MLNNKLKSFLKASRQPLFFKRLSLLSNSRYSFINVNFKTFSKSSSTQHMNRHVKDPYVKKAKNLDYRSRGAFKLIEIQDKYKFLRPGQTVLDLGSSPGGWSQVIVPIIESSKEKPSLIGVDINRMNPINGCLFIQGDFEEEKIKNLIMEANNFQKFDVICSDMCPEFVGEKFYDHVNTFQLNNSVINFAFKMLKKNGILLLKTFDGSLQNEIFKNVKDFFKKISRIKPSSSRSESSEMYLFCIGFLENDEVNEKVNTFKQQQQQQSDQQNKPEKISQEEQEELLKLFQLSKFSHAENPEQSANLQELEKVLQKEGGIESSKLKSLDKESCEKVKKDLNEKDDDLMRELEGKYYLAENERDYEGYMKKYEKDMEFYETKLKEVAKSDKIEKEDEKILFDNDAIHEYANKFNEEMQKEMQNMETESEELQKKMKEEEEEKMIENLEKNQTGANYEQWERVLMNINQKRRRIDEMLSVNKIHEDLEKNEEDAISKFNHDYKNLRREGKVYGEKPPKKIDDSFFNSIKKF